MSREGAIECAKCSDKDNCVDALRARVAALEEKARSETAKRITTWEAAQERVAELEAKLAMARAAESRASAAEARVAALEGERDGAHLQLAHYGVADQGQSQRPALLLSERIDLLVARASAAEQRASELEHKVEFYEGRERHFAKVLSVADGGAYRNDWDAAIEAVVKARDAAEQRVKQLARALEAAANIASAMREEGHSGDEDSGQCDEDCQACLLDALRCCLEAALTAGGDEAPAASVEENGDVR